MGIFFLCTLRISFAMWENKQENASQFDCRPAQNREFLTVRGYLLLGSLYKEILGKIDTVSICIGLGFVGSTGDERLQFLYTLPH